MSGRYASYCNAFLLERHHVTFEEFVIHIMQEEFLKFDEPT